MARLAASISTLRVQDAEASRQFFAQLGFQTVWEHREAEGFPLFLEIRRDAVSLFLSEHKGDGPLGVYMYVVVDDAQSLFDEFRQTTAGPTQPTVQPWGHLVFSIDDLDGNHLSFGSSVPTDN